MTIPTSKTDSWSWGAVLYRMTYLQPPYYDPPCYRPPKSKRPYPDPNLVDVLRRTLVLDPNKRVDPLRLAWHPYTTQP